jgi:hypothetical protein
MSERDKTSQSRNIKTFITTKRIYKWPVEQIEHTSSYVASYALNPKWLISEQTKKSLPSKDREVLKGFFITIKKVLGLVRTQLNSRERA